ncbi:MAG: hypothetical protein ACOYNK_06875 [Microbacteriaceae bacterium]
MTIEQHAEAAAWDISQSSEPDFPVDIIAKHMKAAIDEATETNDHAEVGALLAKCCDYRVGEYKQGWFAEIMLRNNETGSSDTFHDTQLAALRAAVEAAEKGVRE